MNPNTPDSAATPDETSQAQDARTQALHESEERLRLAMMVANDGFWDWKLTTHQLYFDPRYYLMAGYEVDEFPHRLDEFQQRVHPDDQAEVMAVIQELLNAQSARNEVEFRFRKKDGDYLWILSKWLIVERDEQGKPSRIVGTSSDITRRKQAEEALRATEQRLRIEKAFVENLFDVSADTIFVFEPATGQPFRWNDAFRRVTGYTDQEIASLKAPDAYYSQEDLPRAAEVLQSVFRDGKGTVELSLLTKDGKAIPFEYCASVVLDQAGEPRWFISIGRDITERKRAEEALRNSEETFRLAMLASRDGLWDWTIPNNRVYYSPGWAKILGETQVPAVYSTWEERIHPEDKASTVAKLKRHMEGEGEYWQAEHRLRMRDGNWKWVLGRGMVVARDTRGNPLRMIGTMQDISQRKRTEAELQQKLDELQQWYEVMLGREGRVLELKHEADALRRRLGEPPRYAVELADDLPAIPPAGGSQR